MSVIRQDDLISSVADALQFISYYHPLDFIKSLHQAYEKEVWSETCIKKSASSQAFKPGS